MAIVPASEVSGIASEAGLTDDEGDELTDIYSESQISSLRVAFAATVIALLSLLFSRGIPNGPPPRAGRAPAKVSRRSP